MMSPEDWPDGIGPDPIFGANRIFDRIDMLGKCWIEEDPLWFVSTEWLWAIEAAAPPDYVLPLYSNNNIRASSLTLVEPTEA